MPPIFAIARAPLLNAPPALVRRVLRRCYAEAAHPEQALSCADTLALEQLLRAEERGTLNLPGGWMAVREADTLHLTQTGPLLCSDEHEQPVHPGCERYLFQHGHILQTEPGSEIPRNANEIVLAPEVLALHPVLRMPRSDDRIHPFGAPGSKPLRRYLTDRKVDPFFRYLRPVLAVGDEILWIPSLCTSERLRLAAIPPGSIRLIHTALIPFDPQQPKE